MTFVRTMLELLDAYDDYPQARALRERTYEGLGDVVVDVGCGSGLAVGELAALGAKAIGVDLDTDMIDVAIERWPDCEFHVADVTDLPFDDGSLTGYRADKVLHDLPDPEAAIVEAHRVLADGGRALLTAQDWDAYMIDSDDPERTRDLIRARADGVTHPWIARTYRNLLLDNGFTDVTAEVHTIVWTGEAALPMLANIGGKGAWFKEQTARAKADRLFVAVPFVLTTGVKDS
ncbi:methyltransferase domain-containing protein [Amycolatopsis sp. cg5]|uniref:methyltransferase domain-containing protein n=1 Tax=Amycolatopsis sp. cg5 TaxID=3238802 RepID=UPI003525C1D9